MDKLTSSPTASSQCHVCNLCYEDRTKNRFPSLRCFFGFVFFWGESNQSWTGSNPPIPLDHYSPLGLKSKEMSFSNRHKLKWFMKEIALTLSWIFGTCQTSVGLLPSLQFSWLTFNPPNSTNNKDTLKERILCRVKQVQLFKGDTHIHTHTFISWKTGVPSNKVDSWCFSLQRQLKSDRYQRLCGSLLESFTSKQLECKG